MTLLHYLLGALALAVLTWVLVAGWIRVSLRAQILDVPTHRSSHLRATPRGGGVGIVAAVVASIVGFVLFGNVRDPAMALWGAGITVAIALVGFIDDVRSLSSILRLCLQAAAAVGVVAAVGVLHVATLPLFGTIIVPMWLGAVITVYWVVGLANVYNFMDGIDGIAGGQGLVAGLAWAVFGHLAHAPMTAWIGLSIAAACAGFLVHNWSPAKVFMGDVGSVFLGFWFALLPLIALREGVNAGGWESSFVGCIPLFGGLVVWPFVGDAAFTIIRRMKHRWPLMQAHRTHLYQRLTITGWRHAPVALLYIAWAVGSVLAGAAYVLGGDPARIVVTFGAFITTVAIFGFVKREELRTIANPNWKSAQAAATEAKPAAPPDAGVRD
jgi:UDP-N-acetylmuramyl pentapeptide phosphotransferase/UDP-N-acetylglucosamine-1-phosphate transferase